MTDVPSERSCALSWKVSYHCCVIREICLDVNIDIYALTKYILRIYGLSTRCCECNESDGSPLSALAHLGTFCVLAFSFPFLAQIETDSYFKY